MAEPRPCPTPDKAAFAHQLEANEALLHLWLKHQHGDTRRREMRAYLCPSLTHWHLTSQSHDTKKKASA